MSLEDEARVVVAENSTKDEEARKRKALEETPVVPDWTLELIAKLQSRFPDQPVYRTHIIDDGSGYRTIQHEPIGRGWGIFCNWWDEGYHTGTGAVLMRDGTLRRGGSAKVPAGPRVNSIGLPNGISLAIVANGFLINAYTATLPPSQVQEFRRIFGVCGVAAILSGKVEEKDGELGWWDPARP